VLYTSLSQGAAGHLIVDELNAQAEYARLRIGSKDAHSPKALWVTKNPAEIATPVYIKGPNIDLKWTLHGVPGTYGFQLLDGLPDPLDYNYFVWKGIELDCHPYGACYHDLHDRLSTGVVEYLRDQEIECVIVGGLAEDYCAGITGLQLLSAGFDVIFNRGASKAISPAGGDAMIKRLQDHGAFIINCAAELETL
jgi:nicotinamidase/pyrazinamidase